MTAYRRAFSPAFGRVFGPLADMPWDSGVTCGFYAAWEDAAGLCNLMLKGKESAAVPHTATVMLPDYQGMYRAFSQDSPAWSGGRYVDEDHVYATDLDGTPLDPPPMLVGQQALVNIGHSFAVYNLTAVMDAVGVDDKVSAWTITDNETVNASYVVYRPTIPTGIRPICTVTYIKKEASAPVGNAFLELTIYGSTTEFGDVSFNAQTGAYLVDRDQSGNLKVTVQDHNAEWWRVILENTTTDANNNTLEVMYAPCKYDLDTVNSNPSLTGSGIGHQPEIYDNTTTEQLLNACAIINNGTSAVATDALVPEYADSNFDETAGSMSFQVRIDGAGNLVDDFLKATATHITLTDQGGNTLSLPYNVGKVNEVGFAVHAGASLMYLYVNGVEVEGPYSGLIYELMDSYMTFTTPDPLNYLRVDVADGSDWYLDGAMVASGVYHSHAAGENIRFGLPRGKTATNVYMFSGLSISDLSFDINDLAGWALTNIAYFNNTGVTGDIANTGWALTNVAYFNNTGVTGDIANTGWSLTGTAQFSNTNINACSSELTGWTSRNITFAGCIITNPAHIDNILIGVDNAGQSNGTLDVSGGTNAIPTAAGLAAKTSLEGKGWTVTVNS